jgi:DNA-binding response OmpR family regulator
MRLLLIEDDEDFAATVSERLRCTYAVDVAHTASRGRYLAEITTYDLIVLDINLPDYPGTEVCSGLRQAHVLTPILILTAETDLCTVVGLLDGGADDFLSKPFDFPELEARLRALLRRGSQMTTPSQIGFGGLWMDIVQRTAGYADTPLPLRRKEFDILELLVRNQDAVVSRSAMLEHAWDANANDMTNSIDVHVGRLRRIVHNAMGRSVIQTIHGFGWRMSETAAETTRLAGSIHI